MTTEEIEKAAEEYANKIFSIRDIWMYYFSGKQVNGRIKKTFILSAEFVNKYWQEKTRWIPVEERLPELKEKPYYIVVKPCENSSKFTAYIETLLVIRKNDINWVRLYCKYWKEIE